MVVAAVRGVASCRAGGSRSGDADAGDVGTPAPAAGPRPFCRDDEGPSSSFDLSFTTTSAHACLTKPCRRLGPAGPLVTCTLGWPADAAMDRSWGLCAWRRAMPSPDTQAPHRGGRSNDNDGSLPSAVQRCTLQQPRWPVNFTARRPHPRRTARLPPRHPHWDTLASSMAAMHNGACSPVRLVFTLAQNGRTRPSLCVSCAPSRREAIPTAP